MLLHRRRKRPEQRNNAPRGGKQVAPGFWRPRVGRRHGLGLSPLMAAAVFAALACLNAAGLTMPVVEQNARRALGATGQAYVMEGGRVVAESASAALMHDPAIVAHSLGQAAPAAPPPHVAAQHRSIAP